MTMQAFCTGIGFINPYFGENERPNFEHLGIEKTEMSTSDIPSIKNILRVLSYIPATPQVLIIF